MELTFRVFSVTEALMAAEEGEDVFDATGFTIVLHPIFEDMRKLQVVFSREHQTAPLVLNTLDKATAAKFAVGAAVALPLNVLGITPRILRPN